MPRRSPQKVSHLLAADLRRQILTGELVADQQLPSEPELIARLQISRDTLREALRILESQQLLEIKRGRGGGAVVRRPGLQAVGRYVALLLQLRRTTLAHLEEARSVIEPSAAQQVALLAGTDHLDELERLYDTERASGDALSFVTAMSAFDQAVTELSGNRTLAVIAGVFRDIYAGQIYASVRGSDAPLAERIAWRVIASHSAFLEAVRRRDASLAQEAWTDYLYTTSRMLVSRNVSRQPIDMTPLWRAQAGQAGTEPTPRRALSVATEIRARIAEGRLKEGDRLPPLAELGEEFDISRPTLREALRILEMEFLLDLRTGDRGGATIRTPSTRVAAQQAGIVLEARRTTLLDFHRALHVIEPTIMGMVATRINARQLAVLHELRRGPACLHRRHRAFRHYLARRREERVRRGQEPGADGDRRDPALGAGGGRTDGHRRRQGVAGRRDIQSPGAVAVLTVRRRRRRARLRGGRAAVAEDVHGHRALAGEVRHR